MDAPAISHAWEPIADLPADWRDLCREDLAAVHQEWVEQRELLKDPAKLERFQQELMDVWAIETGVIERLYPPLDRGVMAGIAEAGLDALERFRAEGRIGAEALSLIRDQRDALAMVMDLADGSRELTGSYVKELHAGLAAHQDRREAVDTLGRHRTAPLLKGEWKRLPNNPASLDGRIHEYCPPEFVQDEIDRLLEWHREHEAMGVCPEVEAAWLHHRFAQIHPFEDGNGRVARALTAAVFLKRDHLVLVVRDEPHREAYFDALEAADGGDLKPLVDLFADIQIADLRESMRVIRSLRGQLIVSMTESIAEQARKRQEASRSQDDEIVGILYDIAHRRLEEVAAEIMYNFEQQGVRVQAQVMPADEEKWFWWRAQLISVAQHFDYYAVLERQRWVNLRIRLPELERTQTRFVISLHPEGRAADLHTATAFLSTALSNQEDQESRAELDAHGEFHVACQRPFRFRTETTDVEGTKRRFREWLEETIEYGLSVWAERF